MRLVLLIERDRTLRTTFRHFLEEGGYEVVEAEDGDAALEACRASLPRSALRTHRVGVDLPRPYLPV